MKSLSRVLAGVFIAALSAASASSQTLQWEFLHGPYNVTCLAAQGSVLFAGTSNSGVWRSADNGNTWVQTSEGLIEPSRQFFYGVTALASIGSTMLAGTSHGIFRSSDNGSSWTQVDPETGFSESIRALVVTQTVTGGDLGTPTALAATDLPCCPMKRSIDGGLSWASANGDVALDSCLSSRPSALTTLGKTLFVGTFDSGLFRSTNSGSTWAKASGGLTLPYAVEALGTKGGMLFATIQLDSANYDLYRSTDRGGSWDNLGGRHVDSGIFFLWGFTGAGPNLFAGSYQYSPSSFTHSVYISTNDGDSWSETDVGLTSKFVTSLLSTSTSIFAGSDTGVYRTFLPSAGVAHPSRQGYRALSIQPNPSTSSFIMDYSLESRALVTIGLFDAVGRQVASLASGEIEEAGRYTATVNSRNLSPGVYECRLVAGGVQTAVNAVITR